MICTIGVKDLITNSMLADVAANPLTNGMQVGQVYPAEQTRIQALDQIGAKYGSFLYRLQVGGNEFVFGPVVPDDIVSAYEGAKTGGKPSFVKANQNSKTDESLDALAEGLRVSLSRDVLKLNEFVDSTLLSAKKIAQATKNDPDLFDAMSEVWTAIRNNPDGMVKMRMMAQFIAEARNVMSIKLAEARRILASVPEGGSMDDSDHTMILLLEESIQPYRSLVEEFHRFMSDAPSNPVKSMIDAAFSDMESMFAIASKVHEESALNQLDEVLSPKYERAKAEMEKEVARLEANKAGASPKRVIALDRKIAEVKANFEQFAPSRANIRSGLTNKTGTSYFAGLNKFVLAGAMNPDLLIQGFMRKIKDAFQEAQLRFRQVGDEIEGKFQELVDTGFATGNLDETFRDLYQDVKEYWYNSDTNKIEEFDQAYFVSEADQGWRTEFSKLKAELAMAGRAVQNRRQSNPDDRAGLAVLEKVYDDKKNEYIQWRRDNFESEYGMRYLAADAMLDTEVTFGGKRMTLREIRSQYYDAIGDIQNTVEALTGVPTQDEVDEINRLRKEFEEIKSVEGKSSEMLRIAELFTQYAAEMKEMTDRWDISPSSLDRFNLRKAAIDRKYEAGEIDKEAHDRWYATNTTIVYSPKYWSDRKAVVTDLNNLAEQLQRITGVVSESNLKDSYERMEAISRKYRDHNSHIDGRAVTDDERETVLQIENEIEEVKRITKEAYSGFLGQDFAEYSLKTEEQRIELLAEIKELKRIDPSNSKETKSKILLLRRQLKDLRDSEQNIVGKFLKDQGMPDSDIQAFHALYKRYREAIRALSSLTESVETEAYYETYRAELNRFVVGKTQQERDAKIKRTRSVTVGKTKYKKGDDGEFYEVNFDGTLGDTIMPAYAILDEMYRKEFETSDWYLSNHFDAEKYDATSGEMVARKVPLYVWRISKPANKKYIKEAAPNIAWKRRVIAEEFRNPNYATDSQGLPDLKAGISVNAKYGSTRAANPKLWEFRDFMVQKYLDSQLKYSPQDRMGYRVPSIEKNLSFYDAAQGVFTGKGVAGKQIARKYRLNEQDSDDGLYANADAAGFESKFVPVRYRGRLDAALVSRNIVETVGKYVGQAEMYLARVEMAQLGKNIDTTLSFQGHSPSSESMDKTAKFLGFARQNRSRGANQRLDTVRNMIDMFVYGESAAETSMAGRRWHKIMSNFLGFRAATIFSEFPNLAAKAFGEEAVIGSTFWPQLVNWFGGETQQLIKTAIQSGDAKFSFNDWAWAKGQYVKNSAQFTRDIGKISNRSFWTQFGEYFDVQEQEYITNFGEKVYSKGLLRNITLNNLSFFKGIVEHELMMTAIMAFARNYHVNTSGGMISLKDAFTITEGQFGPKPGVELSDTELANIRGNIASLLRDLNGNYGKLDKVYAENYWVFKTMFFMRKWLIPMFVARYGAKKYSVEQDRIVSGYLRESGAILWESITGIRETGWRGPAALVYSGFNPDLSQDQRDALKKTRIELLMMAMMFTTYRVLLGFDPDDEERYKKLAKESYAVQGLTYATVKATSEISTFVPPFGLDEGKKVVTNLMGNSFPVIEDVYDILRKDINYFPDGDDPFFKEYQQKSGIHKKGDVKAAVHLWKLLGRTDAKASPVEALKSFEANLNK